MRNLFFCRKRYWQVEDCAISCELKVNFSIILVVKLFYRLSFWQLPFLHSRLRWETSNPSSQYNFSTDVMQVSAVGVSYCRAFNFQVNHGCCFYSKLKVVLANLGPRAGVNDLHFCQHQESRVPIETITFTFCFQRESLCIAFPNTHSPPFPILFHQKVSFLVSKNICQYSFSCKWMISTLHDFCWQICYEALFALLH